MMAFCFCEACSPLPMGEGPGVRSGLGEGFCFWLGLSVGLCEGFYVIVDFIPFVPWGIKPMMRYGLDALCAFVV